jgi:hypothetical protein
MRRCELGLGCGLMGWLRAVLGHDEMGKVFGAEVMG